MVTSGHPSDNRYIPSDSYRKCNFITLSEQIFIPTLTHKQNNFTHQNVSFIRLSMSLVTISLLDFFHFFYNYFQMQKMEENLNTSSPYFTRSSNTSDVYDNWTTQPSELKTDDVDPHEEIVRMIQVIGRPPIIVLGTIGNLLTFFTMQRGSLKHMPTCFYMAILGLADTGE